MTTLNQYGNSPQTAVSNEVEAIAEEVSLLGYAVIPGLLNADELAMYREKLDAVYQQQEAEFGGRQALESIQEANLARLPLSYDDKFVTLATHPKVLDVVKYFLGNYFVLHLQNGILNSPGKQHHQSSWHRDLPYQDFVISKPLALSVLFCLDNFNANTGGTLVLPHTHRSEKMPSQKYVDTHVVQIEAPAGSALVIDSMIFHRAGVNSSKAMRRGVNHVYAAGILRQQINMPAALKGKFAGDPFLRMLLGYDNQPPDSVANWRNKRKIPRQV